MSVNAALYEFENYGAKECWSCGLGGYHPNIAAATQTRVVKGVRRDLCDRCAELCDESSDGECCLTKSASVLPGSEADRHPPIFGRETE